MGDLISREALLEEIKCYQMDIVSKATAMRVIRNAPAVTDTNVGGKWIPCSERMPERSGKYLVTDYKKCWICEMMSFGHVKGWSNNARNPAVKAWQPLPLPYQEG